MNIKRLNKRIQESGLVSRRKADTLIEEGRVKVNGKVVRTLGLVVNDKDKIEVDDQIINKKEKVYFLLNKPKSYLSSTKDDKGRKVIVDLIDTEERIFPVGRLDYDTTGAILLTNDGDFANLVMHPSNNVLKTYIAKIDKILTSEDIKILLKGFKLENSYVKAEKIKIKKKVLSKKVTYVEISVLLGLNHIIKNMFKEVGANVLELKREKYLIFDVSKMKSGEYIKLSKKDISRIYVYIKEKRIM